MRLTFLPPPPPKTDSEEHEPSGTFTARYSAMNVVVLTDDEHPSYDPPERDAPRPPAGLPGWSGTFPAWTLTVRKTRGALQRERTVSSSTLGRAGWRPGLWLALYGVCTQRFMWRDTEHLPFYEGPRHSGISSGAYRPMLDVDPIGRFSPLLDVHPLARMTIYGTADPRRRTISIPAEEVAELRSFEEILDWERNLPILREEMLRHWPPQR